MFVIGTAGHVDHGKSTLVKALTGINPDRLREEQVREMTIDLGFAWLTLPSGREVSVIDVPGHEDFIKNMLSGIGGIDVALLVVAADEAVMPQTREHLAILDLLQIPQGVVALTKSDLVADPEWLDLVREEVREELQGTALAQAAVIPVSALTGAGLAELLAELDRLLARAQPRADLGRPRLPVDRVFSMAGFGTVVTGTLSDGRLQVGDEVAILPGERQARIRGLQTHRQKASAVEPGARVAANLVGVTTEQVARGQVLTLPGSYRATQMLDARVRVVRAAPWPLKHNALLDLYAGAARVSARVRLLESERLEPGETGWAQLRLQEPVVVARGDRFILRSATPSVTLAGGEVVEPHPQRRHRRLREDVVAGLEVLALGAPDEVLLQALGTRIQPLNALLDAARLPEQAALEALRALAERQAVTLLAAEWPAEPARSGAFVVASPIYEGLLAQAGQALGSYQRRFPLRPGMPREELRQRLQVEPAAALSALLEQGVRQGRLALTGGFVAMADHRAEPGPAEQAALARLMTQFAQASANPPTGPQAEEALGAELFQWAVEQGRLIKASEGVLLTGEAYADMERRLVAHLRAQGQATVAEVRDLLSTSRKYALAFLEETDRRRVTKRLGDVRVLRDAPRAAASVE